MVFGRFCGRHGIGDVGEKGVRIYTVSYTHLDVYKRQAYAGYRIAYVCNKGAVNVAISNKRLTQFGLVSMLDYYTKRCVTC